MTIIAQAEKKQVVRINWLATLAGHETESVLILLCRNLRVNFAAPTRNNTWRARLMSGNVKVNRHVLNLGTKFATTRRVVSSNAAVSGKSDAV